jgi:hypothetical protein
VRHTHVGGRSLLKLVVWCDELSRRWDNLGLAVQTRDVRSMTYRINWCLICACWQSVLNAVAIWGRDRCGWYVMRRLYRGRMRYLKMEYSEDETDFMILPRVIEVGSRIMA